MKLFLTVLTALAAAVTAVAAPTDKAAEELDIREATFRYLFRRVTSAQQQEGAFYFSIADKDGKEADPTTDFMARFAKDKLAIKKVSECTKAAEHGLVVDKKTGEKGIIYGTGAIKWISDTEAEIFGGLYSSGESASGHTYHLKKVDGKWKVVDDVMHWVS